MEEYFLDNINYSYIEPDKTDKTDEIKEEELNPNKILNTFNDLNCLLNKYKDDLEKLETEKKLFYNYKSNLIINHINIIDIYNNYNTLDEINDISQKFDKYDNNIKDIYDKWLISYYNPTIIKLNNDIDILEIKINNFRNFFIFTINKFLKSSNDINKKLCPICFDNEIDMCAYPCGHTCCNNCIFSSRININNNKRCLSCRNEIIDYIKLFFLI